VPNELKAFYREYNPVDVEIASEFGDLRFYSVDELVELQATARSISVSRRFHFDLT